MDPHCSHLQLCLQHASFRSQQKVNRSVALISKYVVSRPSVIGNYLVFKILIPLKFDGRSLCKEGQQQCEQMARLSFNLLILENTKKIVTLAKMFPRVGWKFCLILNKHSKDCHRVLNFGQIGKISLNLVTLDSIE